MYFQYTGYIYIFMLSLYTIFILFTVCVCVWCHTDSQKIAKRLAKQIAKESKIVKDLLLKYNSCCLDDDHRPQLSSALNLEFLSLLTVAHSSPERNKRQEIIEEYLLFLRSREEIELLEAEVNNSIQHYSSQKDIIEAKVLHHSDSSPYSVGAKCLLIWLLHDVVKHEEGIQSTLRAMKKRDEVQDIVCSSDSDFDSDSDSDNDSWYIVVRWS